MKLLYTKRSPYARKVRVLALEKGIPLDLIDEDLANKSKQLLESNPLGKVPTLILDNGHSVFDSRVICQYLDTLNEKKVMTPKVTQGKFKVLQWESMADDMVTTAIYVYMEKVRHPQDFHPQFIANGENSIKQAYKYIEANLSQLKEFNLASLAVACSIGYIHFRLPHLKVEGKLAQWYEEINQRPSMQLTIPVATNG